MMTDLRTCSRCGEPKPLSEYHRDKSARGGHKARCKMCYLDAGRKLRLLRRGEILERRNALYNAARLEVGNPSTVAMLSCPVDAELGVAMYMTPCQFSRMSFQETLAAGYWPDGALVEYAPVYRGAVARWRVSGNYLLEVHGERVACASFGYGEHVRVKMVGPLVAAKGLT